ncbi:MAG: HAD family phosphatase [Betaproteobacteria bacterium]
MSGISTSQNIKAVLFDFGGVLAELRGEAHVMSLVTPRMTREEMWTRWSYSPAVRAHETGRISAEEFARQVVREFDMQVDPEIFLDGFKHWIVGAFDETPALIRDVSARYATGFVSNTSALHWPIIESLDILPYMQHNFASWQIQRIKPDRDYFDFVLQTMGLAPHEAVFLDDSTVNIAAATELGIHAHRVEGAAQARRALVGMSLLPA